MLPRFPRPQGPDASLRHRLAVLHSFLLSRVRDTFGARRDDPGTGDNFGVSTVGVSAIVGIYYYTYAATSLVAGVLLDHYGAKYVIPAGTFVLACGCVLFALPHPLAGDIGRLCRAPVLPSPSQVRSISRPTVCPHAAGHRYRCHAMFRDARRFSRANSGRSLDQGRHDGVGILVFEWPRCVSRCVALGGDHAQRAAAENTASSASSILKPYIVVFSNPQSYLCGVIAGLLFAPTTILDFVWGVRYLQEDSYFPYRSAVFAVSMVPFGWVIGCHYSAGSPTIGAGVNRCRARRLGHVDMSPATHFSADSGAHMGHVAHFWHRLRCGNDSL